MISLGRAKRDRSLTSAEGGKQTPRAPPAERPLVAGCDASLSGRYWRKADFAWWSG